MPHLGLRLTPHGHLVLEQAADTPGLDEAVAARLTPAFAQGSGPGLVQLGAGEVGQALPPIFVWWRAFAARYVAALCLHPPSPSRLPDITAPDAAELASLVLTAPMMPGSEYLSPDVLRKRPGRPRPDREQSARRAGRAMKLMANPVCAITLRTAGRMLAA